MNSTNVDLEKVSEAKYEPGCYPCRVVMWRQSNGTYVTHVEVMPHAVEKKPYFFIIGHYDLTFDEAADDYEKRCFCLGVDTMFSQPRMPSLEELEAMAK